MSPIAPNWNNAGTSRQAQLYRSAGGRRCARSQYSAGGDLHLRADAGQAGGRRAEIGDPRKDCQANISCQRDRQFAAQLLANIPHVVGLNLNKAQETLSLARAPVAESRYRDPHRFRRRTPDSWQCGQTAAGLPEPIPQRPGRHAAGGRLKIRTWREGTRAHVEVADSGQGIPTEHLTASTIRFSPQRRAKGTGLGFR